MPSNKQRKRASNTKDTTQSDNRDEEQTQTQQEQVDQPQSQQIASHEDNIKQDAEKKEMDSTDTKEDEKPHLEEKVEKHSPEDHHESQEIQKVTPPQNPQTTQQPEESKREEHQPEPEHLPEPEHHAAPEHQPAPEHTPQEEHDNSTIHKDAVPPGSEAHKQEEIHPEHQKQAQGLQEHPLHQDVSESLAKSDAINDDNGELPKQSEERYEDKEVHPQEERVETKEQHVEPVAKPEEKHHEEKVEAKEHEQQIKQEVAPVKQDDEQHVQPVEHVQHIEQVQHKEHVEKEEHKEHKEPVEQPQHEEHVEQHKEETSASQEPAQQQKQAETVQEKHEDDHIESSEASILHEQPQQSSAQKPGSPPQSDYSSTVILGEKQLHQSEFDIINGYSDRKNPSHFDQKSEDESEKGIADKPQSFESSHHQHEQVEETKEVAVPETQPAPEPASSVKPPEVDVKAYNMKRFQATLDEATMLKNLGNQCVKEEGYKQAINHYADALRLCHPVYLMECPGELIDSFRVLNVSIMNNLSFCYLNIGDYNDCITFASQVLQVESNNSKAMYRIAQAYEKKDDLEEALKFITQARQLQPQDAAILERYNIIKRAFNAQKDAIKKQQKEVFSRMFSEKPEKTEVDNKSEKKLQRDSSVTSVQDETIKNSSIKKQTPPQPPQYDSTILVSQAVLSTAVTALLTTFVQRQLFKDKHITPYGLASAGLLGSGVFGVVISKKLWQKLAFGAASSGAMAFLIFLRMGRN